MQPPDLHNLHLKGISPDTISMTALDPSQSLFVDMRPRLALRSLVMVKTISCLAATGASFWISYCVGSDCLCSTTSTVHCVPFTQPVNDVNRCCRFRRSVFVYQHFGPISSTQRVWGPEPSLALCSLCWGEEVVACLLHVTTSPRHHTTVCPRHAARFVWSWPMTLTWKSLWACSCSCQFEVTCDYFASGVRLGLAAFVPFWFLLTVETNIWIFNP